MCLSNVVTTWSLALDLSTPVGDARLPRVRLLGHIARLDMRAAMYRSTWLSRTASGNGPAPITAS